ncbi:MAG: GlsB/YeaQ/YmgE family stress response membrane protein [Paracoccaceae bacterium]
MIIIWLIIVGAAAGFLATRLMGVRLDVVTTVALGMAGAIVGGLIVRLLLSVMGMVGGLVGAVLGAVLVIWLYQQLKR